jgi:hypothetical protein
MAWPICPQRIFFVLPMKTHVSGNPWRIVAASSEITIPPGSERTAKFSS